ncbi:hypothetical protein PF011_g32137 [Phytophthora fragariae]|uniref:Uncharacterized protein n=1 Tax=Phytophthora fragariae TaxID=53985 RepID=A0A6A3GCH7_9STRA|nr:hypothetical protein PF011_g32137 [Phytophthora fragariae]
MSTSQAGTDNDNDRAVDDAPLHAPEQLQDAPPVEGGASGSGGAGDGIDTPSDQVNDTPQSDSAILDKAPPRENNPARHAARFRGGSGGTNYGCGLIHY